MSEIFYRRVDGSLTNKRREPSLLAKIRNNKLLTLLVALIGTASVSKAIEETSSQTTMRVEGTSSTVQRSSYVRFTGQGDGLELPLDIPEELNNNPDIDYTLMFWFRSARSFAELSADESLFRAKQYLFDIPGSFGCYISRTEDFHEGEPYLECSTSEQLRIRLGELPDIQSWMHLTYSANFVPVSEKAEPESTSYLQLNGVTVSDLVY